MKASISGQERWLHDYCASGLYILTLLLEGYGFSEETWTSIEFHKQVITSWAQPSGAGALGQLP